MTELGVQGRAQSAANVLVADGTLVHVVHGAHWPVLHTQLRAIGQVWRHIHAAQGARVLGLYERRVDAVLHAAEAAYLHLERRVSHATHVGAADFLRIAPGDR